MNGSPLAVSDALRLAAQGGLDRLDAQLLLSHALERPRTWLLAHNQALISAEAAQTYADLCRRRAQGAPVAYLIGHREFWGLRLKVTPDVLVPRPETELLVEWALQLLAGPLADRPSPTVADLGTGSGAIAVAIAKARPSANVLATDLSAKALALAEDNAVQLGAEVRFAQGPWWEAVSSQRFDLVLSNPPYVRAGDPHMAALGAEPTEALSPGPLGTEALDLVVQGAGHHLRGDGWMLLEHGADQGAHVRQLLLGYGFGHVETRRDLAGLERCTGGCWTTPDSTI